MSQRFQKIDIGRFFPSGSKKNRRRNRSRSVAAPVKIFLGLILVVLVFSGVLFFPAREIYFAVQEAQITARETYVALKNQDVEQAIQNITTLERQIQTIDTHLSRFSWIGYVPFVGQYERDVQHFVKGSIAGIAGVKTSLETVQPYADLLGLKGTSTFVAGSADERIRVAVETLDKVLPSIDAVGEHIALMEEEFSQIDPGRYPERFGSFSVRPRIQEMRALMANTTSLFTQARPLLKRLPDLLGTREQKRYLVLFQNDAELRATGGFITAYGLFSVEKGKLRVEKAADIYKLDEAKQMKFPAPDSILKYHKNVFTLELRDSNLSPDFVVSMKQFESMLRDSVPDFPSFDGIITLDTHVLVSTMKILGEFTVYGRVFRADNDPRCDCPQVIYELEDYSTRPVAYLRDERKDIIGALLLQIMQKALGVSPSQYWGKLSQMFFAEVQQKHILFYFHDSEAQTGIEALNFSGRILPYDGDYLHINDVNFAGAKSNLFVQHVSKQDISLGSDGTLIKTLTLQYKNPSPPSNCNLEAGQLCLNGILRNWLRVYTPKGSKLLEFTGSEKDTVSYDELDKTVFEGFLTVKPQGATEVVVRYTLPWKGKKGDPYRLFIQKQPGTDGQTYAISVLGKEIHTGPLMIDTEIIKKL